MPDDLQPPPALSAASRSLRGLLGVIIAVERRFGHEQSPLELLRQIMGDARWAWLQPFYRFIVDLDHAAHHQALSQEQVAVIGSFAQDLLSGQLASLLQPAPCGDEVHEGDEDGLPLLDAFGSTDEAIALDDTAASAALFIARYRELLQADPEVAIAHTAALQSLRRLPALGADAERKQQLYRQWLSDTQAMRT